MPTYDYRCATCGIDFELFQAFSEDALKKCPTKKSGNSPAGCTSPGRGKVEKVFSAPGITFKGSGFYKTDSRSGSKKTSSSDDSGSTGDSEKSSDTKSSDPKKSDSTSSGTKSADAKSSSASSTKKSTD
jgi:predicted nucleic acid-binding Zn ribbon protein